MCTSRSKFLWQGHKCCWVRHRKVPQNVCQYISRYIRFRIFLWRWWDRAGRLCYVAACCTCVLAPRRRARREIFWVNNSGARHGPLHYVTWHCWCWRTAQQLLDLGAPPARTQCRRFSTHAGRFNIPKIQSRVRRAEPAFSVRPDGWRWLKVFVLTTNPHVRACRGFRLVILCFLTTPRKAKLYLVFYVDCAGWFLVRLDLSRTYLNNTKLPSSAILNWSSIRSMLKAR